MSLTRPASLNGNGRTRVLAGNYYTSSEILEREREQLFFKHWQYACHSAELPQVGSFKTFAIFDQNIILVRIRDDEIQAFYNVCPHRGHRLVEGAGHKRAFVCPYHAWSFSLDGKLLGARGATNSEVINTADICLFPVRTEQLLDFVFVNLDAEAKPLHEYAPGLADQILTSVPDIMSYRPAQDSSEEFGHSYHCRANWKVMIDNYLECYHCETAHKTFNDMMDIPASKFTLHTNYTFQVAPTAMKEKNNAFPLNLEHDVTVGHFWFLFPSTVLGQFPGVPGFYISRFDPLTPHETNRITTNLVPKEMPDPDAVRRDRLRAEWTADIVSVEDKALCENVQLGMRQRGFQAGWYVTEPNAHNISEHAMRYFHDLYLDAMG